MPLLEVKNLRVFLTNRGKEVALLRGVSFSLEKGETLALVGESGSGKSMTALSILRVLPTSASFRVEGEVCFQGEELLSLKEKKMQSIRGSKIAMIFQDPMSSLNPVCTIGEQLLETLEQHLDLEEEEAYRRSIKALEEVKIPSPKERFDAYPHELSGGMKQRVMIAMALLAEPDLLIADEPTTALDVTVQKEILQLIAELQRKRGMGVLLITHDMGVVAEVADSLVVMYAGSGVESGALPAILTNLKHPYSKGLVRSLPQAHKPKEKLYVIPGRVPEPSLMLGGCAFQGRCPHVFTRCRKGDVPSYKLPYQRVRCHLYHEQSLG